MNEKEKMQHPSFEPLVEVTRGEIVESIHFGSVVVCDNSGKIHFQMGDADLVTYLRSTAKPLQVLALMENPASQQYHFSDPEIAIMCASHSGTNEHVRVLQGLQKKIGIGADSLQCGMHLPFDRVTANHIIRGEEELTTLRHNCSGKHSGMLALAALLSAPQDTYLETDNPTQQLILKTCGEMFDLPASQFKMGVDGCSAPVFAVPMRNAARAYALLCQPESLTNERSAACQKITHAMMTHPFLVAGPDRFDTAVMEALPGKLIAKTGAEGFFGIGILPDAIQPGSPALGIMVKILDGDLHERARPVVLTSILSHLGLLSSAVEQSLQHFGRHAITNWRSIAIGEIRPSSQLNAALQTWKI